MNERTERAAAGWQARLLELRANKIFETVVISIIVLSALMVGAKTYDEVSRFDSALNILDWAVTLFFLFEITIRIMAERRFIDFFKSGWNIFDFVIVVASLMPVDQSQTVLLARLLRVFRVLRLVSMVPELRLLMNAFLKALPRMTYVALFMFIIFYIYGAIGSFIFQDINPFYWENISIAMLTLFRVATFESWTAIMYETMAVYPMSWLYYVSFIFISAFIFLNMMIGIVLEVMQKESAAFDAEHDQGEAGDIKHIRDQVDSVEKQLGELKSLLRERKQ
ncbi:MULTISPECIES: ion transporter [Gammaproteobacteria]|uniref:ion transporter n=1 Tax=Gammaproteobacteria TaxID=1236 RepID=UPI000DD035E9|nr:MULTISPECIES: ion transporter [Gammaproteobacteria]RTE86644.1 ion transporter [Aliidiomarina sp. B3213]TCZ90801.1 ion transporter [Lysobacter sp. N42]